MPIGAATRNWSRQWDRLAPKFGGCARGDNLSVALLLSDALWVRIYRAKGEFLDRRHWSKGSLNLTRQPVGERTCQLPSLSAINGIFLDESTIACVLTMAAMTRCAGMRQVGRRAGSVPSLRVRDLRPKGTKVDIQTQVVPMRRRKKLRGPKPLPEFEEILICIFAQQL